MRSHMISLASGVLPEFGPLETIDAADRAGFDAVGLWVEIADWTDATTRDVKARLAGTDLKLLDVEVVWIRPGPPNPDHERIIDIGAELGASNVLVVSSDPSPTATEDKFARLCELGGTRGMRIALEFGMFTDIRTIDMAVSVIAAVRHPAAALLVDPLHLSRSGGSIADVAQLPREWLPYAQICDAVAVGPDPANFDAIIEEALDLRLQTGEGALPLPELLAALPSGLPLSVELRSKVLRDRYSDPVKRAEAVLNVTRSFIDSVGVRTVEG